MATLTINFTPPSPVPFNGYIVKYRVKGSGGSYTQVSPNPTSSPVTITGLTASTNYEGSVQSDCSGIMSTVVTFVTGKCFCASGYSANVDDSLCVKVTSTAATPPTGGGGTAGTAIRVHHFSWGSGGTYIMQPGYSTNGNGTAAAFLTSSPFWLNGTTPYDTATRNEVDGRVNACAVWASVDGAPVDEEVGFSRKFFVPAAKVYYIGLAADNKYSLRVNGNSILNNVQNITSPDVGSNFNCWMVYPVQLIAGDNFIEMVGINTGDVGGLAAEVYDNTLSQLQAATKASDLNILFSTSNMAGQPFNIGESAGWSCPSGYALDTSTDPYTCKLIQTAACL